ncbi:MAG TPA: AAA family ATPase [Pseudonocardiaceae bacterium]|jgi:adenylylsulfate kinase
MIVRGTSASTPSSELPSSELHESPTDHHAGRFAAGKRPMIVAMAGLPGVGKSTVARALATRLGAVVLDKDHIRAGLFPPSQVDYSREQGDFCLDVMYRTAGWILSRDPSIVVILDGCTYAHAYRISTLRRLAADLGAALRLIECVCDEEIALARIDDDRAAGRHPAANRDATLYRESRSGAEPITSPRLLVDTGRPVRDCVADCVAYLAGTAGAPARSHVIESGEGHFLYDE